MVTNMLVKTTMLRFLHFISIVIFISAATKINARNIDHEGIQQNASFPKSTNNSQSRTEEMCKQYITDACKTRVSRSISMLKISRSNVFIVNGTKTDPKEHPHMALIGTRINSTHVDWFCGGSLISNNFVLTAAHCAKRLLWRKPPDTIRLGELNWANTENDAKETDFNITRVIVHSAYHIQNKMPINDIALLKFEGLSSFDEYIRPICLNTVHTIPDQQFIAGGWGSTDEDGEMSNVLRSVKLSPQDHQQCKSLYRSFNNETMLCVGYTTGGKDTCHGDSGGPLQIENEISECPKKVPIYTQIGITSFGEGCARNNTPAGYTRVSPFIPWIESHVWE